MASGAEARMKICRSCGQRAEEDYQYCTNCGSSQWDPAPPQASTGLTLEQPEAASEAVIEEYATLGTRAGAFLAETLGTNIAGFFIPFASLGIAIANLILYRRGRTVGAYLFHIRVVRDTGDLAGFYQMAVRYAASVLSAIPWASASGGPSGMRTGKLGTTSCWGPT